MWWANGILEQVLYGVCELLGYQLDSFGEWFETWPFGLGKG